MKLFKGFAWAVIAFLCVSPAAFSQEVVATSAGHIQGPGERVKAGTNASMERLSNGAMNILYGPLEIPYRLKEDIKRYDPIRGLIPGVLKGTGWFVAREVVGVFEVLTFYLPNHKSALPPFDTDWIYA